MNTDIMLNNRVSVLEQHILILQTRMSEVERIVKNAFAASYGVSNNSQQLQSQNGTYAGSANSWSEVKSEIKEEPPEVDHTTKITDTNRQLKGLVSHGISNLPTQSTGATFDAITPYYSMQKEAFIDKGKHSNPQSYSNFTVTSHGYVTFPENDSSISKVPKLDNNRELASNTAFVAIASNNSSTEVSNIHKESNSTFYDNAASKGLLEQLKVSFYNDFKRFKIQQLSTNEIETIVDKSKLFVICTLCSENRNMSVEKMKEKRSIYRGSWGFLSPMEYLVHLCSQHFPRFSDNDYLSSQQWCTQPSCKNRFSGKINAKKLYIHFYEAHWDKILQKICENTELNGIRTNVSSGLQNENCFGKIVIL